MSGIHKPPDGHKPPYSGYQPAECPICGEVMNGNKLPEHLADHVR